MESVTEEEVLCHVGEEGMILEDTLFNIGVDEIIERWVDFSVVEYQLKGDFKDEDVARVFYRHNPCSIILVGDTKVTIPSMNGFTYTCRFTRLK